MIFKSDEYVVQPANVQSVYRVTSLNIANTPRRVVCAPQGVTDPEVYAEAIDFVDNYAMINAEGLSGQISTVPGFNCTITQTGKLTVSARPGAGASLLEQQSEEIPVTEEECALLETGSYLSRGLKCSQLVGSINGIRGPVITLSAGSGMTLDTETEPHTIIIKKEAPSNMSGCKIPGCEG